MSKIGARPEDALIKSIRYKSKVQLREHQPYNCTFYLIPILGELLKPFQERHKAKTSFLNLFKCILSCPRQY